MFDGQRKLAIEHARELVGEIPEGMLEAMPEVLEAFVPTVLHVLVRFGAWDEILREPRPRPDRPMETAIWHYARGIALATKGRVDEAEREQRAFERAVSEIPASYALFNNSAAAILGVARHMLEGEIEYRKGEFEAGFAALREAVKLDDDLNYDEPWGWMQPTRHALGALLLEQGRAAEALEVYRSDLDRNPNNGWALHGMSTCLRELGRTREAALFAARFEEAWKRADVSIGASCFCAVGDPGETGP